jgi:RNA polymerase II subunit A small phosphatase-like protein
MENFPQVFKLPSQGSDDKGKLTVVLDIDETLVHTSRGSRTPAALESFEIHVFEQTFTVFKRPGLDEFLRKAASKYELIAFTAGLEEYSRAVLKAIDPGDIFFRHCLFRQHCAEVYPNTVVKDLRIINRSPSRTVLVDNTLTNFLLQPENGVPITSFFDDSKDSALNVLIEFLTTLDTACDVRTPIQATFQLPRLLQRHILEHAPSMMQAS